jgi:histone H1/5
LRRRRFVATDLFTPLCRYSNLAQAPAEKPAALTKTKSGRVTKAAAKPAPKKAAPKKAAAKKEKTPKKADKAEAST